MPRRRRSDAQAGSPSTPGATTGSGLAEDAHAALTAFAAFQSAFAAAAAEHAQTAPIEVRLLLSETAVDIARTGQGLNSLASLLGLPERVATISPEAAEAVAAAAHALRSGRA